MVFLWWCFCGGVFVVVFLWRCLCGGVFVAVSLWWCSCGGTTKYYSVLQNITPYYKELLPYYKVVFRTTKILQYHSVLGTAKY